MKSKLLIITLTALATWIVFSLIHGVRSGVERLWLVSAIKVPGRMAIEDIQADMKAGRFAVANAKLQAFLDTWQRFNRGPDSFSGRGIGDVMMALSRVEAGPDKQEQDRAADGSQPISSETNRTSSAAGSRR